MSQTSITDRVAGILVEQLGVERDKITPEAKFQEDLGADSLDSVEIIMAVEEEFDVEIPDEQAEKMETVGSLIAYLEDRGKS